MIRVCCKCGMFFGEKEPLADKSQTHGYCPPCFRFEMFTFHSEKIGRIFLQDENVFERMQVLKEFIKVSTDTWERMKIFVVPSAKNP